MRKKEPNKGLWSPPGGMLLADEEPRAGALREFREETGLTATDASLAAVVWETNAMLAEAWLMFVYRARARGEPLAEHREGDPAWVSIEALASLPKPPADMPILEAALAPSGIAFIHVAMAGGELVKSTVHGGP